MPLVHHRNLASWERLEDEGIKIASPAEARNSGLPELHIGFLNMMPDRALKATERQFIRLLASGADQISIYVHPFTIEGLPRQTEYLDYVSEYYDSFKQTRHQYLDGLVLTGANPGTSQLEAEGYWPHFEEVIYWANLNVSTVFCSCLATHGILKIFHNIERIRCKPDKRWGVYKHQITQEQHPLMDGMPVYFDAPRSHVFEMTSAQVEPYGVRILAFSEEADFHIAVSEDGFKWVFSQGHPEYDAVSLLKEYKREIDLYEKSERIEYPDFPANYLPESARNILQQYRTDLHNAMEQKQPSPEFPESAILPLINNTWSEHGRILFRNWLGMMVDRNGQFGTGTLRGNSKTA